MVIAFWWLNQRFLEVGPTQLLKQVMQTSYTYGARYSRIGSPVLDSCPGCYHANSLLLLHDGLMGGLTPTLPGLKRLMIYEAIHSSLLHTFRKKTHSSVKSGLRGCAIPGRFHTTASEFCVVVTLLILLLKSYNSMYVRIYLCIYVLVARVV